MGRKRVRTRGEKRPASGPQETRFECQKRRAKIASLPASLPRELGKTLFFLPCRFFVKHLSRVFPLAFCFFSRAPSRSGSQDAFSTREEGPPRNVFWSASFSMQNPCLSRDSEQFECVPKVPKKVQPKSSGHHHKVPRAKINSLRSFGKRKLSRCLSFYVAFLVICAIVVPFGATK